MNEEEKARKLEEERLKIEAKRRDLREKQQLKLTAWKVKHNNYIITSRRQKNSHALIRLH